MLAGTGRLFLISGEPGIGKTRLAEELATEARVRRVRVVWGRCWAGDGAPAYWPWVQVVRSCLSDAHSTRIDELVKPGAPQVADLLPETNQVRRSSAVAPRLHAVPSADPEEARFRLFDSVARLLNSVADAEPVMIILDDLQEADQPSLLMLRFIARQLKEARVLIVGSYREAEVRDSPALSRLIGEIARDGHQVLLSGLKDSEIASWLQLRGGVDVSPTMISALTGVTGGNPLFIDGMLRMLAAEGQELSNGQLMIRELRLPENVRQTIRHRLSFLSKQANEILSIAAVIGQEFEFECLRTVAGSSTAVIIEALNQARRDSLINPVLAGGVSYRFAHDLIRDTIYDGLPAVARASLHLRIGQALEAIHQSNLEPHLAELAHHYCESLTIGDAAKAIDYSIRAGEAAQAVFAYEQVSTHWRAALALMESHEVEGARRADLLRKIGVLIFYTSDYPEGIKFLEASLKLCTTVGNPHMTALARAELGLARGTGSSFGLHISVPQALMHFRESEALLTNEEEPLTLAKVYLGIARTALEALEPELGLSAARRGMRLAERLQNPALWNLNAAYGASHLMVIGRHAEAEPLLDRARKGAFAVHDPEQSRSMLWSVGFYYMLMRDPREARQLFRLALERPGLSAHQHAVDSQFLGLTEMFVGNLAEAQRLADRYGTNAQFRSQIAFRIGDFEATRQSQLEFIEYSRKVGNTWNECNAFCHLTNVLLTIGDYDAAEVSLAQTFMGYRPEHVYMEIRTRPQAALLAVQRGDYRKALEHLEVCRRIFKLGENWRGLAGFVERAEAAVEARTGQLEHANHRFEKAIGNFKRYSLLWEIADTFHLWGSSLIEAGERVAALEKFDAAIDIYRRHVAGQRWIDRVAEDRRKISDSAMRENDRASEPHTHAARCSFCQEGDYWAISFADKTIRMKDARGFHYLAYLLRRPGVEVSAAYLAASKNHPTYMASTPGDDKHCAIRSDLGDAGPHLDARAKADYSRRIKELHAELAEAERFNDIGRAERNRLEIEVLAAQLKAASGLGGIDRKAASHAERARSAVSKRIRFAIRQIQKSSPALGDHLSRAIRTGYHCIYQPTASINWQF